MTLTKLRRFIERNPLVTLILLVLGLTLAVSLLRLTRVNPNYVYVKIKMGQGLWWANTEEPPVWFLSSLKKGEKALNLLGVPQAEVLAVKYYPHPPTPDREANPDPIQFNVYLTVKLAVSRSGRGQYSFGRSALLVGSPIELELSRVKVSGTVIEISDGPPKEAYLEKRVTLTKKFAYPWEYDAIKIGDKSFDGENVVFEVLSKRQTATAIIDSDFLGNFTGELTDPTRYIVVEAMIKVLPKENLFIYGEENVVAPGKSLAILTSNYNFSRFVVAQLE